MELTLVSFSPFKPTDNSNEPGAPAPVHSGHVGHFFRVLRAVRDSGDKRYNGVPRNRVLHGTKEGRNWTLGYSDKGQERGRSGRQGGEWKDPLTDGALFEDRRSDGKPPPKRSWGDKEWND